VKSDRAEDKLMRELELNIEVVPPPSHAWRKNARQVVVALCGAAFLAGAMPVVAQPFGDDDDDDDGVVFSHHRHHHQPIAQAITLAAPIIFDAPLPLVVPPKPRVSERVRRRQARDVAEKSEFLQILARASATEPAETAKQAVRLPAPRPALLDASDVDSIMRERGAAFSACYDRALKNNATLAGNFKLSFTVAKRGDVQNAKVEPRDADGLGACLKRVVKGVHFGPTTSPVDVTRNLRFHPGH
jgi:hypothetical protein